MKTGTIVKSTSGHDKEIYHVIIGYEGDMPLIADGRRRKLQNPKKKNPKHLSKTNTVIDMTDLTDKKLRAALHSYNFPKQPEGV